MLEPSKAGSKAGSRSRRQRRFTCNDAAVRVAGQVQPVRLIVQEALWLPMTRRSALCCPQLVSMSKRSAALEGRLRETSAREGQLRSALQHTAAGGAAPAASHVANGGRPVSLLACVPTPLMDTRTRRQQWAGCVHQHMTHWHLYGFAGTAPRGEVALATSGPASSAPAAVDLAPDKAHSLSLLVAGAPSLPLPGLEQTTSGGHPMLWMAVQPTCMFAACAAALKQQRLQLTSWQGTDC